MATLVANTRTINIVAALLGDPGLPPSLVETVEIERLSPLNVRYRRWDGAGNLLEDRKATAQEITQVDEVADADEREQARLDFLVGLNALPGSNPLKAILKNLSKAKRWE